MPIRHRLIVAGLGLALWVGVVSAGEQAAPQTTPAAAAPAVRAATKSLPDKLSDGEYWALIEQLSEPGGNFRSDNLVSNEIYMQSIIPELQTVTKPGRVYLGVGPEQNFTYIAKLRPRIAFIIDIRRQAIIQHLMYKAIFHLSPNRLQFLSKLLSKPLAKDAPSPDAPITEILAYLGKTAADDQTYASNLAAIRKTIQEEFQFPLNEQDQASLDYVFRNFRAEGLDIAFRIDGSFGGYFPSLKDLIVQPDQHGKPGNFLAIAEDYDFVRGMHRKNLIIPIVGNFGGQKALSAIGDYLRKNNFTVTAFYASNVEQYLFDDNLFAPFANNVRKLPINDKSLFIRSVSQRYYHPAMLPGHRSTTFLQQMTVFMKDFDAGRYQSYRDLITTNYIAPDKS